MTFDAQDKACMRLEIQLALRISQWKNTSTLWLHGFWSFDWADNYVRVETVNATGSSFIIDNSTPPVYGMCINQFPTSPIK